MEHDIIADLKWRYATKKFDSNKKLNPEKLDKLKQAFDLTATSYGLQALKMVVVSNPDLKAALVEHSWNQLQVKDASQLLVICRQRTFNEEFIKAHFNRIAQIRNTPREVLEPFQEDLIGSFKEKDSQEIALWLEKQAYIALGNLMTVCAVERIDACPMEGFIPEGYNQVLDLASLDLQPVLVLPVGYRSKDDFFAGLKKVRRGIAEVIIEI